MLSQALLPYVLGRAVDDGLANDDRSALLALGRGAARARQRPGCRRRDAPSLRRLELAAGVVPARPDRLSPHRERRAGGSREPDDGRGRRDRLERRDESRRRVRHHGPAGRGDRLLRRRRRPAALVVAIPRSRRPRRRSRARRQPLLRDPPVAGTSAGAARGGRPPHRSRRGYGRGPPGAPRESAASRSSSIATEAARSRCGSRECGWPCHSRRSTPRKCSCPGSSS